MGAALAAAPLAAGVPDAATAQALLARPQARHEARHAARRSARERTSKFLLDVPRLELDATIDIEPETGSHIERLQERHGKGVGDRGDEPCLGGGESGQPPSLEPKASSAFAKASVVVRATPRWRRVSCLTRSRCAPPLSPSSCTMGSLKER